MIKTTAKLFLILLLISYCSTTSVADTTLSAQAVLNRVSQTFLHKTGYQSSSHVTIFSVDSNDKSTPEPGFDINTTVEKPNLLSLVTTQNSNVGILLLTDGTSLTVFNAPKLTYVTSAVSDNPSTLLASIHQAAQACLSPGQIGQLQVSLTVPFMFYQGNAEIALRPRGVTRQAAIAVIQYHGKRAFSVTQAFVFPNKSRINYTLIVDPLTNLPISFAQSLQTPAGTRLPMIQQDFSKFVPLVRPLPLTGYSFVPPPGSVQVTN